MVEPATPSSEAAGKRGVSFSVRAVGRRECSDLEIASTVELTRADSGSAMSPRGWSTASPDALCGSYSHRGIFGKITGQDNQNWDMIGTDLTLAGTTTVAPLSRVRGGKRTAMINGGRST